MGTPFHALLTHMLAGFTQDLPDAGTGVVAMARLMGGVNHHPELTAAAI